MPEFVIPNYYTLHHTSTHAHTLTWLHVSLRPTSSIKEPKNNSTPDWGQHAVTMMSRWARNTVVAIFFTAWTFLLATQQTVSSYLPYLRVDGCVSRHPMLRPQHGSNVQPRQTTEALANFQMRNQWILCNVSDTEMYCPRRTASNITIKMPLFHNYTAVN